MQSIITLCKKYNRSYFFFILAFTIFVNSYRPLFADDTISNTDNKAYFSDIPLIKKLQKHKRGIYISCSAAIIAGLVVYIFYLAQTKPIIKNEPQIIPRKKIKFSEEFLNKKIPEVSKDICMVQ